LCSCHQEQNFHGSLIAYFSILGQPLATDVGVGKFRKLITLLIGMNCSCQKHEGERSFAKFMIGN
jgi:hypothetical protein